MVVPHYYPFGFSPAWYIRLSLSSCALQHLCCRCRRIHLRQKHHHRHHLHHSCLYLALCVTLPIFVSHSIWRQFNFPSFVTCSLISSLCRRLSSLYLTCFHFTGRCHSMDVINLFVIASPCFNIVVFQRSLIPFVFFSLCISFSLLIHSVIVIPILSIICQEIDSLVTTIRHACMFSSRWTHKPLLSFVIENVLHHVAYCSPQHDMKPSRKSAWVLL